MLYSDRSGGGDRIMTPEEWRKSTLGYHERHASGVKRTLIFRDIILREIESRQGEIALLDIGCGGGFDDSPEVQRALMAAAAEYVGVEPDPDAAIQPGIRIYRGTLEESGVPDNSIDVAFAVMVLEHVADAEKFFSAIHRVLKPGGVFYAFTPNKRHYVSVCSNLMEVTGVKNIYLRLLYRSREHTYENFPTYYRCNSAADIQKVTKEFRDVQVTALGNRIGQSDYYFPKLLRPTVHLLEAVMIQLKLPGTLLICRTTK